MVWNEKKAHPHTANLYIIELFWGLILSNVINNTIDAIPTVYKIPTMNFQRIGSPFLIYKRDKSIQKQDGIRIKRYRIIINEKLKFLKNSIVLWSILKMK